MLSTLSAAKVTIGQALLCGVDDLQHHLVGASHGDGLAGWAGPDDLQPLLGAGAGGLGTAEGYRDRRPAEVEGRPGPFRKVSVQPGSAAGSNDGAGRPAVKAS